MKTCLLAVSGYNDQSRLSRLEADIVADGYATKRLAVDPAMPFNEAVNLVNSQPSDATNLIGNVPIPFAGPVMYDGHYEHWQPWSTDGPYAGGQWYYNAAGQPVYGWGPYYIGSPVLTRPVGRIDFRNLTGVDPNAAISDYLDRNHAYRTGQKVYSGRAYIINKWQGQGSTPGLDKGSVDQFQAGLQKLIGQNIIRNDAYDQGNGKAFAMLGSKSWSFFLGYSGGDAGFTGQFGIGHTKDIVAGAKPSVLFDFGFGSYYGDFAANEDWLRAKLLYALGALYTGFNAVDLSPLLAGASIGDCVLAFQNSLREIDHNWMGDVTLKWKFDMDLQTYTDMANRIAALENWKAGIVTTAPASVPPITPGYARQYGYSAYNAAAVGWRQAAGAFSGGNVYSFNANVDTSTPNAAPLAIYQNLRYASDANGFDVVLPKLSPNQPVLLRFHWADPSGSRGARSINIAVNGVLVLAGLDIIALAGDNNVAYTKDALVSAAADGSLNIHISGTQPFLCAVELFTPVPVPAA